MGIGISGILQATEEQLSWLSDCYEYLREFDKDYSKVNRLPTSIKLTTVKPSGTLSLLPGVLPGIHPGYSRFMIRRIRIASDHNLVEICRNSGYPIEYIKNFDGSLDYGTVSISFPYRYPDNAIIAKDMTAIQQLEWIKRIQTIWSDNGVSCTVYYNIEELNTIKDYLRSNFKNNFKAVSFLLHQDHGFEQAPYEEITEEEYNELINKTRPIDRVENLGIDYTIECEGGHCPVR